MPGLSTRTMANMEVVLEQTCRGLSASGGDHESRKFIAEKLRAAAEAGLTTLGELEVVARQAIGEMQQRKA